MGLDFARGADLFMGSEQELALALDVTVADLRMLRTNPKRANEPLMKRLAVVLIERGEAMKKVGVLLQGD